MASEATTSLRFNVERTSLTLDDLRAAMATLDKIAPVPKIDLWPHDLNPAEIYELHTAALKWLPHIKTERRQLCVPRQHLDRILLELQEAGCDVQIQPKRGT